MNRNWTKVTKSEDGEFDDVTWKCEDQPELEGTLTGIKTDIGRHSQTVYTIETEDGDVFSVWETAVLKTLLKKAGEGNYLKIVYLGKKTGKAGAKYKDFDVFIANGIAKDEAPVEVEDEPVVEKPKPKKKVEVKKESEPEDNDDEDEEEVVPF